MVAQGNHIGPLAIAIRFGYAGVFVDAFHLVAEMEGRMTRFHTSGDGRSASRIGRTGQGNMACFGQQSRSRVQANPACTGNVNLRPGVQICKILGRTGRTVQGFLIGFELYQIPRHKTRRQTKMPQGLHQYPARIAARAQGFAQGFLTSLDASFHADAVVHLAV